MLVIPFMPKSLYKAFQNCVNGQERTNSGLKKGSFESFVVVQHGKNGTSRLSKLVQLGHEVYDVFENNKPWGVIINKVAFKYITQNNQTAAQTTIQNVDEVGIF